MNAYGPELIKEISGSELYVFRRERVYLYLTWHVHANTS